ncbi:MAG: gamma-glutamyl-gamma-aminobutyrate hydrolase family protein [Clostridia bacterium]|nr:gamma-glutamyl-gamma-aminobutyrate hydrolase family protein [Clostridia bacterium]
MVKVFIYNNTKNATNYTAVLNKLNTPYVLSQDINDICDCTHLLLCGGGDVHPAFYCQQNLHCKNIEVIRDLKEFYLINYFFCNNLPILGVCRGMQILNLYFGGTLRQTIKDKNLHFCKTKDCFHFVNIVGGFLNELYNDCYLVNSSHRQCVDKLGKHLVPIAFSDDLICEGFAHKNNKIIAVQFHPERLDISPEYIYKYFVSLQ